MTRYSFDPERQQPIGFGRAAAAFPAVIDNAHAPIATTQTTITITVADENGEPCRLVLTPQEARALAYDIDRAARDAELKARANA
jgi:hypothetical protein